jgi:tetratricopeptide (TPR) repeat protein
MELQLADTLSKAGFNAEAAGLFERLTSGAPAAEAFELRGKSAYCYAISGHIDEGKAAYRTILSSVGLRLPESPAAALRSVIFSRLKLWRRGTRFDPRTASAVSPADLQRIDTAWSAATALTMVDLMAGASFTTRHLLLALDAGEPNRVVRALGWEAVVRGTTTHDRPQADRMLAEADRIAAPFDPYTRGMLTACTGFNHASHGRWRKSVELFDEAAAILRRDCPDCNWELNTVRNFRLYALYSIGAWPQMAADARLAMEDAHERGDLYSQALIGGSVQPLALMLADRPDEALRTAAHALSLWTAEGFHMEHIQSARSTIHVKLYAGDPDGAWRDIQALWPILEKNHALRSEWDRIGFNELRARSALALLRRDPNADVRRALHGSLRSLRKEANPYGVAMARTCDANIALAAGDRADAVKIFEQALEAFARMDCPPALAAGRRCFGIILGGERGAAMIREADEVMLQHGVASPAKTARILIPSAQDDMLAAGGAS